MKVLAFLVLIGLGLVVVGIFMQAPAVTGGPNPYGDDIGQLFLAIVTVVVGVVGGIAIQTLREKDE